MTFSTESLFYEDNFQIEAKSYTSLAEIFLFKQLNYDYLELNIQKYYKKFY